MRAPCAAPHGGRARSVTTSPELDRNRSTCHLRPDDRAVAELITDAIPGRLECANFAPRTFRRERQPDASDRSHLHVSTHFGGVGGGGVARPLTQYSAPGGPGTVHARVGLEPDRLPNANPVCQAFGWSSNRVYLSTDREWLSGMTESDGDRFPGLVEGQSGRARFGRPANVVGMRSAEKPGDLPQRDRVREVHRDLARRRRAFDVGRQIKRRHRCQPH